MADEVKTSARPTICQRRRIAGPCAHGVADIAKRRARRALDLLDGIDHGHARRRHQGDFYEQVS